MRVVEDFEDTTYVVSITGNWTRTNATAATGSYSLRSAAISHNNSTQAVVQVPAGAQGMTFAYRVSTEYFYDVFEVLAGGQVIFTASGESDWVQSPVLNVSGQSTVTFRYTKDTSDSAGLDAVFIDDLTFITPDAPPPVVVGATSASAGSGTSMSITVPSGVRAGDLVLVFHSDSLGTQAWNTTITGGAPFTLLDGVRSTWGSNRATATSIWWKIAGPGEPSSYQLSRPNGGNSSVTAAVVIRDAGAELRANKLTGSTTVYDVPSPGGVPFTEHDLEFRWVVADSASSSTREFGEVPGYTEVLQQQYSTAIAAQLVYAWVAGPTGQVVHELRSGIAAGWHGWTVNVSGAAAAANLVARPVIVAPGAAAIHAATW